MAKKAELLEQAKKLKLEVSSKSTIAELEAAIKAAGAAKKAELIAEAEPAKSGVRSAANKNSVEKLTKAGPAENAILAGKEAQHGILQEDLQKSIVQEPVQRPAVSEEIGGAEATAKAGKRSAKALKEAEEKAAKEKHKAEASNEEPAKPKRQSKPARSRLERRGKKFRELSKLIEKGKIYPLAEALELAIKTSPAKFDATVELHIKLNVDPKHADQNVRDSVVLPAGTGKTVRIAVFADDKVAGADLTGIEVITKLLDKGQLDFDVLIATPANMPKLGKYARVLGPRGLMPNPKSGTVTADLGKAVAEAEAGRVEYRVDSTGIVHLGVGKVSFGKDKLLENTQAVASSLKAGKPASIKGAFIASCFVSTTMGPSIATVLE